jgi:hypothetical protein
MAENRYSLIRKLGKWETSVALARSWETTRVVKTTVNISAHYTGIA